MSTRVLNGRVKADRPSNYSVLLSTEKKLFALCV